MNLELILMSENDIAEFKKNVQCAFQKGFEDVFVRIYDDSVDVIVDKEQISQQEAAQIQDIVTRVTGVKAGNIRISLLKIGKE